MIRVVSAGLLLGVALAVSGCAGEMSYGEMRPLIPALQADSGRIYFYRESHALGMGDVLSPEIHLNGEVVGESDAGKFFFVDRPPGKYEISCGADMDHAATVSLVAGQEIYVSTRVGSGIVSAPVIPEQIAPAAAVVALYRLKYGPLH